MHNSSKHYVPLYILQWPWWEGLHHRDQQIPWIILLSNSQQTRSCPAHRMWSLQLINIRVDKTNARLGYSSLICLPALQWVLSGSFRGSLFSDASDTPRYPLLSSSQMMPHVLWLLVHLHPIVLWEPQKHTITAFCCKWWGFDFPVYILYKDQAFKNNHYYLSGTYS